MSSTTRHFKRQVDFVGSPTGDRILSLLSQRGHDRVWLASTAKVPLGTLQDYIKKGVSNADNAVKIADALNVSVDWLLTGRSTVPTGQVLAEASALDWININEFDPASFTEGGKGDVISTTAFRRDWLNQTLRRDTGLWLTTMPGSYVPLGLEDRDHVFCIDISRAELRDRHLCIWWGPGIYHPFVARYSVTQRNDHVLHDTNSESWVNLHRSDRQMAEGGQPEYIPLGRILGRSIAPIK